MSRSFSEGEREKLADEITGLQSLGIEQLKRAGELCIRPRRRHGSAATC